MMLLAEFEIPFGTFDLLSYETLFEAQMKKCGVHIFGFCAFIGSKAEKIINKILSWSS